jgi:hypothetical protein
VLKTDRQERQGEELVIQTMLLASLIAVLVLVFHMTKVVQLAVALAVWQAQRMSTRHSIQLQRILVNWQLVRDLNLGRVEDMSMYSPVDVMEIMFMLEM